MGGQAGLARVMENAQRLKFHDVLDRVLPALLAGGLVAMVMVWRATGLVEQKVDFVITRIDKLEAATADRYTSRDHAAYAAGVEARISSVEARLAAHRELDGHPSGMAQVIELRRRIEDLEERASWRK